MDKILEDFNLLKTANVGQIPDKVSDDGTYLPKDVSTKIIEEIMYQSVIRKYLNILPVEAKTLSVPTVTYGLDSSINAYKVSHGTDIRTGHSDTSFTTSSIVLSPQLLVSFVTLLETDLATAGIDLSRYIMQTLTKAIAKAEEACLIRGAENAQLDTYTSLFNGIYTIANSSSYCATTPITFGASDDRVDKVADAVKAIGAWADDRSALVLVCSNTFATALRKEDKVVIVGDYAPREGVGAVRTGLIPRIHGVPVIESSQLESCGDGDVAILMRVDGGLLGQRGKIIFRTKLIEESFSRLLIMAEEIDFDWGFKDGNGKALGIVLIEPEES